MPLDLHSLPAGSRPDAVRNNGPDHLVLERYKLRELAEGWPLYRCEPSFTQMRGYVLIDLRIETLASGRTSNPFSIPRLSSTLLGLVGRTIWILSRLPKLGWTMAPSSCTDVMALVQISMQTPPEQLPR